MAKYEARLLSFSLGKLALNFWSQRRLFKYLPFFFLSVKTVLSMAINQLKSKKARCFFALFDPTAHAHKSGVVFFF